MKFKWYKIPLGTEVEIVNKDSKYFRKRGKLGAEDPYHMGCNIWFEDKSMDCFCWNEFLPTQNVLDLSKLNVEKLSQVFEQNYLYETNRIVVYIGEFTNMDVENAYKNLVEQLARGECNNSKAEYVLALLKEIQKSDVETIKEPIREMITFVQWWVEGLRNHVTSEMKDRRYFEMEHLQIDFVKLD